MNNLSVLIAELEAAEVELSNAEIWLTSCRLNTPGKCKREQDRYNAAKKNVARLKKQLSR